MGLKALNQVVALRIGDLKTRFTCSILAPYAVHVQYAHVALTLL